MKNMVFNQTEYDSILMALKSTTSKRSAQRLYTVLHYLGGYKQCEIANLLKIDVHTVSLYIKKYKAGGISNLIERKYSPGTPTLLNPEQEEELVKVITEGLWKWLKSEVINNVFFPNVCQIQKAVRGFMNYIKEIPNVVIDRLCVKM